MEGQGCQETSRVHLLWAKRKSQGVNGYGKSASLKEKMLQDGFAKAIFKHAALFRWPSTETIIDNYSSDFQK